MNDPSMERPKYTQKKKKHRLKDCPTHVNKSLVLKRLLILKFFNHINNKILKIIFSKRSEKDDDLSSCSYFTECPSSYKLEFNKPVLRETEHLRCKIG